MPLSCGVGLKAQGVVLSAPQLARGLSAPRRCLVAALWRPGQPFHTFNASLTGGQPTSRPWAPCARRGAAAPRLPPPMAQRSTVELLLDAVPGKSELLAPKLDPEVRQRAERAITARGGRVTIGDVASTAGLRLDQAESAVRALAADSQATLQVADDGEIVWVFQPNFSDTIRSKSLLLRLEPAAKAIQVGTEYLLRVAFGTALIVSVATVFVALTVLASSGKDDNRRDRGGGGYAYYGGGPRMFFDLTDMLWYLDPFYYRHRRERQEKQKGGMNFLEAIFSWVFGDGDPNDDFDKKRWQAIGRYIQSRGGRVVGEELAPFLDLQPGQLAADRGRVTVDEAYMLPVLARFNGSPEVDARGNIVYSFPDLQQTAAASGRASPPRAAAMEQRWELTAASAGQKLGAVALGAVNLVGVVALSFALGDPVNKLALARNGMMWVMGAMPFLQVYAAAFFAIPFVRSLQNAARNAAIDARNEARQEAVRLLRSPDATLQSKLAGAAAGAKQRIITDRDVVYRSDRPLEEQPADLEAENFEERLRRRERERQQQPPRQADEPPQWWQQQQRQRQRDRL